MGACDGLKQQLEQAQEARTDIEAELRAATNGETKSRLLQELKGINSDIASLQQRYEACVHPPPPLPDLYAERFVVTRVGNTLTLGGVVQNIGAAPAHGPFAVNLGAEDFRATYEITVQIPAGTTIAPHGGELVLPESIPGISPDGAEFFMQVDAAEQVPDANRSNNSAMQKLGQPIVHLAVPPAKLGGAPDAEPVAAKA